MGISRKVLGVLLVASGFLVVSAPALPASAGQSAAGEKIKQEVPDNPAVHTPPDQPLPYSHKQHLAIGLTCSACHKNPEPGKLMTYPASSICMGCHKNVAKNKPTIKKLALLAKSDQPIPWVRIYTVLPGVNWQHRKHIEAGMKCEGCHGQVSEIERMSELTSVTTMAVCLNCHKAHNAPTVCQTCHPWPAAPTAN